MLRLIFLIAIWIGSPAAWAASQVCSNERLYFASTTLERGAPPRDGVVIGSIRVFLDGKRLANRDRREGEAPASVYRLNEVEPATVVEQSESGAESVTITRGKYALVLEAAGLPPRELARESLVCVAKRLRFPPPVRRS